MLLPRDFVSCPGLYYGTSTLDGELYRIRIPGGILSSEQFCAIADLADNFGSSCVQITNRANLQIRKISTNICQKDILLKLQKSGVAFAIPQVDHLRNIMGSPTAGIDPQELIDTRPLVQELNNCIATHPEWAPLSPKFSIAVDGGGCVSISDRPNDILLAAVMLNGEIYFRLQLRTGQSEFVKTNILLKPQQCLPVVAASVAVYLQNLQIKIQKVNSHRKSHQPRFFEVLNYLGIEKFLQAVASTLNFPLPRFTSLPNDNCTANNKTPQYQHLGIRPQRQSGFFYIGTVVPLGRLETWQMRLLGDIAQRSGSSTLRLTPWQNLLLPDIPQQHIPTVLTQIENTKLSWSATNIHSALVACTGNQGCASSATDTQNHAWELAQYLHERIKLDQPVNIHFTGCEKSCAQQLESDITLLGHLQENSTTASKLAGYRVFVGNAGDNKFGIQLCSWIPRAKLPLLLERMLQVYLAKRTASTESFRTFVNRHTAAQLQAMFEIPQAFHPEANS